MTTARAVVLLSGSGRTLGNFLEWIGDGRLPLKIVGVVSSRADAPGIEVAAAAALPVAVFRRRDFADTAEHNAAINAWLAPLEPDLIVLGGYLCFYIAPTGFAGPVVNIHPALLPRHGGQGMYGDRVHEAVLAAGETESGCTVHLVDDRYDHGRILAQRRVPVLASDDAGSLGARVFAAERELYPRVLADLARGLAGD